MPGKRKSSRAPRVVLWLLCSTVISSCGFFAKPAPGDAVSASASDALQESATEPAKCLEWRNCSPTASASDLEKLIAFTVSQHPRVAAAEAEVRSAKAVLSSSRWERAPSPYVEAMAGSDNTSSDVGVEVPIWRGGAIKAQIREAETRVRIAEAKLKGEQLAVASAVAEAYSRWFAASLAAQAWESSLAEHEDMRESLVRRSEAGLTGETDVVLATSKLVTIKGEILIAEAGVSTAFADLANAAGAPLVEEDLRKSVSTNLPHKNLLKSAIDSAVDKHPTVMIALLEVQAKQASVALARASLFPALSVRLNESSEGTEGDGAQVMLRTSFGGGLSSRGRVREAEASLESTQSMADATRRTITQELASAQLLLSSASARVGNAQEVLSTTDDVFRSIQRQWEVGQAKGWQDVLSASRDLASNRARLGEAQGAELAASWRLSLLVNGPALYGSR